LGNVLEDHRVRFEQQLVTVPALRVLAQPFLRYAVRRPAMRADYVQCVGHDFLLGSTGLPLSDIRRPFQSPSVTPERRRRFDEPSE
jgi:hypothetical protein